MNIYPHWHWVKTFEKHWVETSKTSEIFEHLKMGTLIGIGCRHDPQSKPATGKSEGGPRICKEIILCKCYLKLYIPV